MFASELTRRGAATNLSLPRILNSPPARANQQGSVPDESRHHSADRSDPHAYRRPTRLATRSQLGLRAQRGRRRRTAYRTRPVLDGAPVNAGSWRARIIQKKTA